MKPQYIKLTGPEGASLNVIQYNQPHFGETWQFHEELELTLILEGTGTQLIGDSIQDFGPGNLVLIGSKLLHLWKSDDCYYQAGSTLQSKAIVTHFLKDFAGKDFLQRHEALNIRNLLYNARRGIKVVDSEKLLINNKIEKLINLRGIKRLITFLSILETIATDSNYKYLASSGFVKTLEETKNSRLNYIFEYIMNNFTKPISLDEISEVANMTRTSFCRFFKTHTRKTFSQYLNEKRIGYACKLLQDNKYTVAQICFRCGFSNLSYFNRQFKKIKGRTPTEYQSNFVNTS